MALRMLNAAPTRVAKGGPARSLPVVCHATATPAKPSTIVSRADHLQQPAERVVVVGEMEVHTADEAQLEREFADYSRATQQLDELASLQAELLSSVARMDSLLSATVSEPPPRAAPRQQHKAGDSPEERRLKREASRAARKAAAAQDASASTTVDVMPAQEATYSIAQPPVPAPPATPVQQQQAMRAGTSGLQVTASRVRAVPQSMPSPHAAQIHHPTHAAAPPGPTVRSAPRSMMVQPAPAGTLKMATGLSLAPARKTLPVSAGLALPRPSSQGSAATSSTTTASRARNTRNSRVIAPSAAANESAASSVRSNGKESLSSMLKSMGEKDLLMVDQQKELSAIVKDLLGLEQLRAELRSILKRDPDLFEWAAAAQMDPSTFRVRLQAGQDAKSLMLKSNYRLVVNVVKKYQGKGLSLQELITEGMHGLLRGVEKFDADKGFRFSTYAHWWIRQSVTRAIQDQTRAVRLPTHMLEQLAKIMTARNKLMVEHGRTPNNQQLAKEVGLPEAKVTEILIMASQNTSLDTAVGGDDDDGAMDLKDSLADERSTPDEVFEDDMLRTSIDNVLSELTEREAGVVRMHWGLDGKGEATLEDIGARFQVTRERIRQIEARAIRRLKEMQRQMSSEVMLELSDMNFTSNDSISRASRGTKKT